MRIQFFDFWVLSYLATHLLLWLRVLADGNCLLPTAANSSTQPACVSTRSVFDKYLPFPASDRLFSSNNGSAELIQTAEIHMYIQAACRTWISTRCCCCIRNICCAASLPASSTDTDLMAVCCRGSVTLVRATIESYRVGA